jgi:hypothetical protein
MRAALFLSLMAVLVGCASNSGVVATGAGTYMVSRQAATGFAGLGKLKAEALREAGDFCREGGKTVQLLKSTESEPPYVLGNYPRVEIEFTCQ